MQPVFKLDENGLAIPELATGQSWVMLNQNVLMSIKLDGIIVRTVWVQGGTFGEWKLFRQNDDLEDYPLPIAVDTADVSERAILKAFSAKTAKSTGKYIYYGADINGNPHRFNETLIAKYEPMHHHLIVQRNKTIVARSSYYTTTDFFNSIRRELEESPEIAGLCFHLEDKDMKITHIAEATKQQFGVKWPGDPNVKIKVLPPVKPYLIDSDNDEWGLPC